MPAGRRALFGNLFPTAGREGQGAGMTAFALGLFANPVFAHDGNYAYFRATCKPLISHACYLLANQ